MNMSSDRDRRKHDSSGGRPGRTCGCAALFLATLLCGSGALAEDAAGRRGAMVEDVAAMAYQTRGYLGRESLSPRVMDAMARVPRHEFVPADMQAFAYMNQALPIGYDQTISQPFIVALMTDLAEIHGDDIVLEIGTGSGYQAAILAQLAARVYTIEIVEPLGREAERILSQLGYDNVTVRIGDGYHGWPEHGPFDAIIVTAAPERVPQPLLDQLKPGGRLVIPVGAQRTAQSLRVIEKDTSGELHSRDVLPVGFVPLTGTHDSGEDPVSP